jgi:hypothetical protein
MQGLWYGDKRDRVKWGALVHLAKEKNISCIIQVAYFRHGPYLKLQINECEVEREVALPQEVWDHFSDLRHIERLGDATGLEIIVLDEEFKPGSRPKYIAEIVSKLKNIKCRKIVFLDPDTGIEPKNPEPEHVTTEDLQEIWANEGLLPDDLLVVYQHADRTNKWLPDRIETMSSACGGVKIETITGKGIASDVAMLWCLKDSEAKSVTNRESIIESESPTKTTEAAWKPGTCPCACGEKPEEGIFMPGHDGRVSGWILQIERKGKKASDFPAHIADLYDAWVLAGKPGGNHPQLINLVKRHQE